MSDSEKSSEVDALTAKADAIADEKEMRSFLRDEYMFLQQTYEDFDRRLLTIKGWSVTVGASAIVAGFVAHKYAWIGGIAAAGLFWSNEGMWKRLQFHYRPRIIEIETAFGSRDFSSIKPFQVSHRWMDSFWAEAKKQKSLGPSWSLSVVMVPHFPIAVICAVLLLLEIVGVPLRIQYIRLRSSL